jgi:hypothetical protein
MTAVDWDHLSVLPMAVVEMEKGKEGEANGRRQPSLSTCLGRQIRAENVQRMSVFPLVFSSLFISPSRFVTIFVSPFQTLQMPSPFASF